LFFELSIERYDFSKIQTLAGISDKNRGQAGAFLTHRKIAAEADTWGHMVLMMQGAGVAPVAAHGRGPPISLENESKRLACAGWDSIPGTQGKRARNRPAGLWTRSDTEQARTFLTTESWRLAWTKDADEAKTNGVGHGVARGRQTVGDLD
jgi:hypothetical protein